MELYLKILIVIIICAAFAGGIYFITAKMKAAQPARVIKASAFTPDELHIVDVVRRIMPGIKLTTVYIYKDPLLWKDFITSCSLPETVKGVTLRSFDEIHIRRFGDTDSDKTFAQLVLHEFNHILGMEHTAEMTAEDIRITKLVFDKLGYI